jgi:hypothetical protein
MNRSPQLGVTVQATRHLLACAVFTKPNTSQLVFKWTDWRIGHNLQARAAHYNPRSKPQP